MTDDKPTPDYTSPACMAGEIAPDYFDPLGSDETAAKDAARWRKAERARLLAEREGLDAATRQAAVRAIAEGLDHVFATRFQGRDDLVLAGFWPIRAEVDLRDWMARQSEKGRRIALPVVTAKDQPLIFRPWSPDAPMQAGRWNIPEPDTQATLFPQIVLMPLVGWDSARYRMGYGGGFYDRTLAALRPRPYAIGVGLEAGRLRTIYPQGHDVALDLIVTEKGTV